MQFALLLLLICGPSRTLVLSDEDTLERAIARGGSALWISAAFLNITFFGANLCCAKSIFFWEWILLGVTT
jgi:hypothetical protein